MFELLATSFPVFIQYYLLKKRGLPINVWTMKTAVFLWLVMAFGLFLVIFYYHPKSFSGIAPFKTISVVAQTSGPVQSITVQNGQRVKVGDTLFTIEDSSQRAALERADAELNKLNADQQKTEDALNIARASVDQVRTQLAKANKDLENAETLRKKGAGTVDRVREAQASVDILQAELSAAQANFDLAKTDQTVTLPAQREVLEAALKQAQVELDKTVVKALNNGTVTQLALSVGSPASKLIIAPAMIIIPEREKDRPLRFVAGFKQVSGDVIHVGMPAEIACESNANLFFENSVMPAKITGIQPVIKTGQVTASGNLLEPSAMKKGSMLVYFELLYKEHEAMVIPGGHCVIQTYTNSIDGLVGHIIAATGIVKAVGLRLKVWISLVTGVGLAGGGH